MLIKTFKYNASGYIYSTKLIISFASSNFYILSINLDFFSWLIIAKFVFSPIILLTLAHAR